MQRFIHLVLIFAFHSDGPFSSDDDDGDGDGGDGGGSSVGYSNSNQFDLGLANDFAGGLFSNIICHNLFLVSYFTFTSSIHLRLQM